ncbi:MAG: alpha-isopropylmalate synthase regulatory domain-containing protein, partial [Candidatus Omnitrophica bacterium]|nr:alpha-isopropylmalate synthase regulatory domain-containing protein [Candidatus Omnitrophota bacterium]
RHPYAGDLVYTAFSGSHQDAIHKGMKAQGQSKDDMWNVPYLPIDPKDAGRDYESIIRINSQSGKGGVAYVMERDWGFHIPKEMQPDFARVIQKKTESAGRELSSKEIMGCFRKEYLAGKEAYRLKLCAMHNENRPQKGTTIRAVVQTGKRNLEFNAAGNGPVDAFVRGLRRHLKFPVDVVLYEEHALSRGADANAVAYIGITGKKHGNSFGVGIDADISTASIKAVLGALSRIRE